jgi:hypothetical protein
LPITKISESMEIQHMKEDVDIIHLIFEVLESRILPS